MTWRWLRWLNDNGGPGWPGRGPAAAPARAVRGRRPRAASRVLLQVGEEPSLRSGRSSMGCAAMRSGSARTSSRKRSVSRPPSEPRRSRSLTFACADRHPPRGTPRDPPARPPRDARDPVGGPGRPLRRTPRLHGRPARARYETDLYGARLPVRPRVQDLRARPLYVRRNVVEDVLDEQDMVLPVRRLHDHGLKALAGSREARL